MPAAARRAHCSTALTANSQSLLGYCRESRDVSIGGVFAVHGITVGRRFMWLARERAVVYVFFPPNALSQEEHFRRLNVYR